MICGAHALTLLDNRSRSHQHRARHGVRHTQLHNRPNPQDFPWVGRPRFQLAYPPSWVHERSVAFDRNV